MTPGTPAFQALLSQVHRRRSFRHALVAGAGALAAWTAAMAVAVGVGRLALGLPVGAVATALLLAGLTHAAWRAWRARTTRIASGIWIDRTLGLPETAATAAELLGRPEPSEFREVLSRHALEAAEPQRATLLAFGSPPAALDLVVGAGVLALALAFLPRPAATAGPDARGEPAPGDGLAAARPWLSEEEARRAEVEGLLADRRSGVAEAVLAARLARLEEAAGTPAEDAPGTRDAGLDERLAALSRRLGGEGEAGAKGGGSGSGDAAAPRVETAPAATLDAAAKQEALLARPDWPRELDGVVARYFRR